MLKKLVSDPDPFHFGLLDPSSKKVSQNHGKSQK